MARNKIDMTEGSIPKKLITFALPLIATNMLQQMYTSADNAVVGQFASHDALAAVGATSYTTNMILYLVSGLALGNSIINSNLLGKKDLTGLRKAMHTSIIVALIAGVFISILGFLITPFLMRITECPEKIIDMSILYMRIIFLGAPATVMYNFGAGILRTHGDSKRPLYIILCTGLLNVVLNLVFVVCFHMTVEGVALATIISKYVSAITVLWILFDPKGEYKMQFREIRFRAKEAWEIVRVGMPCSVGSMVFSLSSSIVQMGVNKFGEIVVAGSTASNNVTSLIYQVTLGFYSASVTFSGQNYGAGNYKRIDKLLMWSSAITVTITSLASAIVTLWPGVFISIFNTDPQVIAAGSQKLIVMSWSYVLFSFTEMLMGALRGMKKTSIPSVINIFFVCIVRIAWVLAVVPMVAPNSLQFLYACYPISYILSAIALLGYYLICRRKLPNKAIAA